MSFYTKLFNSLITSTVWNESNEVRIVWITMLTMATKQGIVESSLPGLALLSRLSLDNTREAISRLSGPDKESRSQVSDGRRIEPVEGGWRIINHAKYRDQISEDQRREYFKLKKREYRARQLSTQTSTLVPDVQDKSDPYSKSTHTSPSPSPVQVLKIERTGGPEGCSRTTSGTSETSAAPPARSPEKSRKKNNLGVITKLVHVTLDGQTTQTDFASLKNDIKTECARKHIAYDAELVGQALESALAIRRA